MEQTESKKNVAKGTFDAIKQLKIDVENDASEVDGYEVIVQKANADATTARAAIVNRDDLAELQALYSTVQNYAMIAAGNLTLAKNSLQAAVDDNNMLNENLTLL